MGPDKAAEVKAWLQKAANDLRGAEVDLAASPPLIEDALFHCQQTTEKALKGFLTAHDRTFRKTHDLDELSRACEEIDPSLRAVLDPARDLTVFAWEFRYPGGTSVPSEEEAQRAFATARRVYDSLLSRLPKDVHP
jgi:HEPN domain-containing protein